MGKLIYLDNAATTKTAPEVVDAMLHILQEHLAAIQCLWFCGCE